MRRFALRHQTPFRFSLGDRGEVLGWAYLLREGYRLLEKNFRCSMGEIDVVAERDGRLVFVEIKTRKHHHFGLPEEAVHAEKQRRLLRMAEYYLKVSGREETPVSLDVLAVTWHEDRDPDFRLIRDAVEVREAFR